LAGVAQPLQTTQANIPRHINTCGHRHSHPVPHKPHTPILPLVQTPAAHSATRTRPRGPCHTSTLSLSFSLSLSLCHTHALAAHWQHTRRHTDTLSDPVPLLERCTAVPGRLHACQQKKVTACQHNTRSSHTCQKQHQDRNAGEAGRYQGHCYDSQ
jgi:hypothetical protein